MTFPFRFERRETLPAWALFATPVIAVALTLVLGAVLFAIVGAPPLEASADFVLSSFGSRFDFGELLMKALPLTIIAQGLAIGFRANVWNLGAEGQLIAGCILAALPALAFPQANTVFLFPFMVLLAVVGGMLWALPAAILRVRYNVNEIFVTLMLTSVAVQLLSYLVLGPLTDPNGNNTAHSAHFGGAALLSPIVSRTQITGFVFMGLVVTLLAWGFDRFTLASFKMRVGGLAPAAARYAGFSEKRSVAVALLVGGATSGLAGVGELASRLGQLESTLSPGYGFAAITVAFLGRLNPLAIPFSALLVAGLYLGGETVQLDYQISHTIGQLLQGALLVILLACDRLLLYRPTYRARQTQGKAAMELADHGAVS